MKISSRFTVAVHALLAIYAFEGKRKLTSEFIAGSIGVNPVVVRRTLMSLKAAGLCEVRAGTGGAIALKPASEVTLFDVYRAVDCTQGSIFNFHPAPNPNCPVGKNIHFFLDPCLERAQKAMEGELKKTRLSDLMKEFPA